MLEKIKKESIPDKVFELLKREILNGTYKLGDRLPTEMELCRMLGVSRVSVKTALNKLCIIGITEARVGDGTYVTNLDPHAFISHVQEFIALNTSDDDVSYYRIHFDVLSILMAMHRITNNELEELEALAQQMQELSLDDEQQYNHIDYTFHYKLCLASKNKIQIQIFHEWEQLIYASVQENNRKLLSAEENRAMSNTRHNRMLDALKTKDLGLCMDIYNSFILARIDKDWSVSNESPIMPPDLILESSK